jgi:hypothetical protein
MNEMAGAVQGKPGLDFKKHSPLHAQGRPMPAFLGCWALNVLALRSYGFLEIR